MASRLVRHVISPKCSSPLQSFFIDKEENHLFENIVTFELYCSILYCCIFCLFQKKKRSPLNMSLFAKSVSLFKKM